MLVTTNQALAMTNQMLAVTNFVHATVCCDLYIFWGSGMSEVQMLNNVGDRTPLCGTPVLIRLSFETVPLHLVILILL